MLKGRISFPQHIRTNIVDRSRFYVEYDEFSANRPANRLIHLTIYKLKRRTKQFKNMQLLNQLEVYFIEVPKSVNVYDDWTKHTVDRSMQHYNTVMRWIGLFLFGHGLTTFSGKHLYQSLLFPMEKVFEYYVADAFRRHQDIYDMKPQGPPRPLATDEKGREIKMRPDISLLRAETVHPEYILDTKWKRIKRDEHQSNKKFKISGQDMYQMFAYGKIYNCKSVGLIYPKSYDFYSPLKYEYDGGLNLFCLPFDVTNPKESVEKIMKQIHGI